MGATDTAFIKAYEVNSTKPAGRRAILPGVYVDEATITVAMRHQAVSHLYAAADRIRPGNVPISSAAAAQAVPANLPGLRIDAAALVQPPAPHLAIDALVEANAQLAEQSLPLSSPIESPVHPANPPASMPTTDVPSSPPVVNQDANAFPPMEDEPTKQAAASDAFRAPSEIPSAASQDAFEIKASESFPEIDTFEDALAMESTVELTTVVSEPWQAQWEVDAVDWPPIVEKLNEKWAGELSALIRPLITSAWKGQNVIAVTSFNRGEGATTMSLCLARMAASFRIPVALIDGDLVAPTIGERLGLAFGQGWNTLPPELPLYESAIGSNADHLVVVPASSHLGMGNEAHTAHLALAELAANFELVIVDVGPIFTAAHRWFSGPAAKQIHGTLIVRDVRETTSDQIDDVCSRLDGAGMDRVAIVENFRNNAA